jgi:hypothetical protein
MSVRAGRTVRIVAVADRKVRTAAIAAVPEVVIVVAEASGDEIAAAPADVAARIRDLVAEVRPTLAVALALALGAAMTVAAIATEAGSVAVVDLEAEIAAVTGLEVEIGAVVVIVLGIA